MFERANPLVDCVQFQELLLASKLVFIGGVTEAKFKGRGEECVSQNLRVLRGRNGNHVLLFFANSQRQGPKRYVSIPRECGQVRSILICLLISALVNCVASVKPPKKPGRPVVVEFDPNFDILSQMRNLTIQFLDNDSKCPLYLTL